MTDRRSLAASPGLAIDLQLQKIEQAAKAGVDWIQIREKDLCGRELAGLVERAMTRVGSGSAVLVNDRVDVACATGACGVHLGERSLPPSEAKRLVRLRSPRKDFFVGVSAHSLEGAMAAQQAGAEYVIFGPVFATSSKAGFGKPQGAQRCWGLPGSGRRGDCSDPLISGRGESGRSCEGIAESFVGLTGNGSEPGNSSGHQPAEQADLSGVVNIMKSNAVQTRKKFFRPRSFKDMTNSRFQSLVFPFQ